MDSEKIIDIPFGAHDSELKYWEYTIPEGMEAVIKDGKVIVREKKSENERIIQFFAELVTDACGGPGQEYYEELGLNYDKVMGWLEKQKENPKSADSIPSYCTSDAKCEDRWHRVQDSLPDSTREVLCKDAIGNYFIGRYYSKGIWEISMYDDCDKSNEDNPPVVMWIDIPSEKQKEPENVSASAMIPSCWETKQKEQKPEQYDIDVLEKHITKDSISELAHTVIVRNGWEIAEKEQKQELPLMGGDTDTYFDDLRMTTKPLISREWFDEGIKYAQRLQKEQKPAEYLDKDKIYAIMNKLHDLAFSRNIPINSEEYKKIGEITADVRNLLDYPIEQKSADKSKWDDSDMREDESELQTRFAFYTYKDDSSVLYLSNLFVEEGSRNHGFGTRILNAAEKVAETIGATTISLKVKQNSSANAWYRKNGYGYVAFEDGYDWLEKNLEYLKPTNQKWSEEDEMYWDGIIRSLWYLIDRTDDDNLKQCLQRKQDWLKSLPERFNLQAKQELSEEDEKAYQLLLNEYKQMYEGRATSITREEVVMVYNFLKAFRPFWKPSEEQMEALGTVLEHEAERVGCSKELEKANALYEQLKKLM